MAESGTVTALWRYPVKSMLGEALEAALITSGGIEGDRAVAVIDQLTGHVATAKHPKRWRDLLTLSARWDNGAPLIVFPDGTSALADSGTAVERLSAMLEREVTLSRVRPAGAVVGRPDPEDVIANGADADVPYRTLEIARGTSGSNFVDFGPVHFVTSATLEHVGEDVIRYRPNLVLDIPDSVPFAENDWTGRQVAVGQARLAGRSAGYVVAD